MIPLIFLILLVAVLFAWRGKRSLALSSFIWGFIFAIIWFYHHMTSTIGLSL